MWLMRMRSHKWNGNRMECIQFYLQRRILKGNRTSVVFGSIDSWIQLIFPVEKFSRKNSKIDDSFFKCFMNTSMFLFTFNLFFCIFMDVKDVWTDNSHQVIPKSNLLYVVTTVFSGGLLESFFLHFQSCGSIEISETFALNETVDNCAHFKFFLAPSPDYATSTSNSKY